jgi:hypothetical protein
MRNIGFLSRIFFAMRTRKIEGRDTDTEDRITLIINEDGVEKLKHIFPDTPQEDQEAGKANLYSLDRLADLGIRSENLNDSSIQVAIEGEDWWFPEHVLIWGEEVDGKVVPLAAEWDIEAGISTEPSDPSQGNSSFPVRRISYPIDFMTQFPDKEARVEQILVILTTADKKYAGTDNQPVIEITYGGGRELNSIPIRTLRMNELERAQAFFSLPRSSFPHITPPLPRWNNLEKVVLRIDGDEAWLPSSFSMFGFTAPYVDPHPDSSPLDPRPNSIMPLIHIPNWNFGRLSTEDDEGVPSVSLPLLPIPSFQ